MATSLHEQDYRAFVMCLVALRKEAGVTQFQLADRVGKPQSYVSKYERYERRLDPAEFRVLVLALGGDPVAAFADASASIS